MRKRNRSEGRDGEGFSGRRA